MCGSICPKEQVPLCLMQDVPSRIVESEEPKGSVSLFAVASVLAGILMVSV